MKNVLARGGIEFLAVLLGISGSLWIDDYSEKKELDKQDFRITPCSQRRIKGK